MTLSYSGVEVVNQVSEMIEGTSDPEKGLFVIWIHTSSLFRIEVLETIVLVQCGVGTGDDWASWGVGQFKLAVSQEENAYVHRWAFNWKEKRNLVHLVSKGW